MKIRENFNFGHNFRKASILFETPRFWSKFPKIAILVKKIWKILIEIKIFEISRFGLKFRKITISVKIFENLNFGEDFRNISISINIFENLNFGQIRE